MEHDKPIHSGNLLIPAAGKILLKKSWQQKHCLLFKASKFGIERLEIYENPDSTKQTPLRIITLQDCIKIIPRHANYFAIMTKSGLHEFEATSRDSMNEWLSAIQAVAFPDDSSRVTSIQEDNDLYCPSGEGIFNVKLHESTASMRCGLEAKQYLLVLTNNGAQLRNCHDNATLFTWPYCFIRRYGYKNGRFTFEAGRKCESGEGIFYLEHSDQQEIFRCFSSKIKSMKKLLSHETFPTILDMDNSFHAAFNMEARSRSPLPLSLSSSTSMHDIEQNFSTTLPKTFVLPDITEANKPKTLKPKPSKPPRRNLPVKIDPSSPIYEVVNKYEEIEYRSEAWKTMGVNDVDHVETEVAEQEDMYMSWGVANKKTNNAHAPIVVQAPKVITETVSHDYDKLDFFGPSGKLNGGVPSTYKQVKVVSNETSLPEPPSFNVYDEVEFEARPPVRKDLKKDFKHVKVKDVKIDHQFHNNEPYTLISKPKHV